MESNQETVNLADEVIIAPNSILTTPCEVVPFPLTEEVRTELFNFIKRLIVHCTARGGLGIAANQLGESWQVFVMKIGSGYLPVINPKIVKTGKDFDEVKEGCLSHPNVMVKKIRHSIITVSFSDLDGNICERVFKRKEAYIVQHEMDHILGHDFLTHSGI